MIIGYDTAGLAVAYRLASNTSVPAAVIEAGDFYELSDSSFPEVPAYISKFTVVIQRRRILYLLGTGIPSHNRYG